MLKPFLGCYGLNPGMTSEIFTFLQKTFATLTKILHESSGLTADRRDKAFLTALNLAGNKLITKDSIHIQFCNVHKNIMKKFLCHLGNEVTH